MIVTGDFWWKIFLQKWAIFFYYYYYIGVLFLEREGTTRSKMYVQMPLWVRVVLQVLMNIPVSQFGIGVWQSWKNWKLITYFRYNKDMSLLKGET